MTTTPSPSTFHFRIPVISSTSPTWSARRRNSTTRWEFPTLRSSCCAATRSTSKLWFRERFIFSSAFGPAMQTMFRGEQLRILVQIFNQVPFGLITRPEIKRLEDLKGAKIAVTFGGSSYSLLQAIFAKHGLPANFADYINIPDNPSKIVALQQGRVVAALMAPPADKPSC